MKRAREVMPMPLFQKIVDECGRHGARKILPYLHGETLLIPGVLDYFRYVRRVSPQSHLNLTTNGSRLSDELAGKILEEDLLDSVIVSIDGGDKETFESIRINLDYDEVRSNVLNFIRRRNELGKSSPSVSVAMVAVEENKHTRESFREAWREADDTRYSVYFNWAGKLENEGRTPHKINFCERLQHYITILADGRVAMCCFDSEAEYAVGDLREASIHEIWHSEAFNEKRRLLYEKNFDKLKLCAGCDYINHPRWVTPLARMRPTFTKTFPQFTAFAESVYKRWLMR
jgi:radical SAM protein with 4Fe4S-binding SPASM domain